MPEPPDIRADFLTLPEARSILAKIHPGEDILRAIFRIPHRAPESRDTNSRSPARTDLQFPEGTNRRLVAGMHRGRRPFGRKNTLA